MKTINNDVPFVGNTPDDTHCLQAAYAMIRQYFEPDLRIDWDDWAEVTGYFPGKGTWSMAGLMWFKDNGYDVVHIARFDYVDFALRGPEYLVDALDEDAAKWNIKYTDFTLEKARATRFTNTGIWIKRSPTIADIEHYLAEGYLIKCCLNLNALNDKPGYLSHAVLVKGMTDTEIIIHDPGLPARPDRYVPIEVFLKAWEADNPNPEKMDAIRKMPIQENMPKQSTTSAYGARMPVTA